MRRAWYKTAVHLRWKARSGSRTIEAMQLDYYYSQIFLLYYSHDISLLFIIHQLYVCNYNVARLLWHGRFLWNSSPIITTIHKKKKNYILMCLKITQQPCRLQFCDPSNETIPCHLNIILSPPPIIKTYCAGIILNANSPRKLGEALSLPHAFYVHNLKLSSNTSRNLTISIYTKIKIT